MVGRHLDDGRTIPDGFPGSEIKEFWPQTREDIKGDQEIYFSEKEKTNL